jgi:hypothetical protein
VNPRDQPSIEVAEPRSAEFEQVAPSMHRVAPQACNVDAVADRRERLQQSDAVIHFDGRAVKIPVHHQVMHANADLQDALVQVADLTWRCPP